MMSDSEHFFMCLLAKIAPLLKPHDHVSVSIALWDIGPIHGMNVQKQPVLPSYHFYHFSSITQLKSICLSGHLISGFQIFFCFSALERCVTSLVGAYYCSILKVERKGTLKLGTLKEKQVDWGSLQSVHSFTFLGTHCTDRMELCVIEWTSSIKKWKLEMLDGLWPTARVTSESWVHGAMQWAQSHVFSANIVAMREQPRAQKMVWHPGPSFCLPITWSQASHIMPLILNSFIYAIGIWRLTWEIVKNPISIYFSTGSIWLWKFTHSEQYSAEWKTCSKTQPNVRGAGRLFLGMKTSYNIFRLQTSILLSKEKEMWGK